MMLNRSLHGRKRKLERLIFSIPLYIFLLFFVSATCIGDAYGQCTSSAKYIIIMIADGWGAKQIEATARYTGADPIYQTDTNWTEYWMSTFATGGSYDTTQAWTNFQYVLQGAVTDSAAAASALFSGSKTQIKRISVSSDGTERLFTIGEIAKSLGLGVGAVSTVPVSHATPGAWMAHNDDRGNGYAIADEGFFEDPNTTGLPTDSLYGGGHGPTSSSTDVIIGDRRSGYVNSSIRDKLALESGLSGKHFLVERQSGQDGGDILLSAANDPNVTKLAGLFDHTYHKADDSGFNQENPTLADSTNAALTVLNRNPNGFVLMVEGGAIDWGGHANNLDNMIGEKIDFDEAVQAVIDWVEDNTNGSGWGNTLVIITGDHETGYLTAGPDVFPDVPLGNIDASTLSQEKIYSGSGGRRASWDDIDGDNIIDPGEEVYWAWHTGGHTNSLIPLYARGAGSILFDSYSTANDTVRGTYLNNTDVFLVMDSVIGNTPPIANDDTSTTFQEISVIVNVVTNDTDSDGTIDPATVVIGSYPTNGTVITSGDGTVSYTPDIGYTGQDTFTYTVHDDCGTISNQATTTITVNSGTVVFSDDFSTDSNGDYTVTDTWTVGGTGSFQYDPSGQRVEVLTGDDIELMLSHALTPLDSGSFSVDFLPTVMYPSGGKLKLYLREDENNYYILRNTDGYGPGYFKKYVNGVEVERVDFSNEYAQNSNYSITISFSPGQTTVNAFGEGLTISMDDTSIVVSSFEIEAGQQDAYFDNIVCLGNTPQNQPPSAVDDTETTTEDLQVSIDVVSNDSDMDGTIDPATVVVVSTPANGTAVSLGDGTISYTPYIGYTGQDAFTYTVDDNLGANSNEAMVTVTVNSGTVVFSDDFSTDSTGDYTVTDTWTVGGTGSFQYDPSGQRVEVLTGDDIELMFSHALTPLDSGSFSVDFLPTVMYPSGGKLKLYLREDENNYYILRNTDGYGPGYFKKYVNGVEVERVDFSNEYAQNSNYSITISFSPVQTAVNAFGEELTISTDDTSIVVSSFEIEAGQQDAYFDNIVCLGNTPQNQPPTAVDDTETTTEDLQVSIDVVSNDSDMDGTIDPATVVVVSTPANGTAVSLGDGTISYTPYIGYTGQDAFTYTVDDNLGANSNEAIVTVTVNSGTVVFSDDFSTDSTGDYTVTDTWTVGGTGSFQYDPSGQRVEVLTGDDIELMFSHALTPLDSGSFSVDFLPTVMYPSGGKLKLYLREDENNYYILRNTDGYGPGYFKKYVNGVEVERVDFSNEYAQNSNYSITISFSPVQTTVNAFGEELTILMDDTSIVVSSFEIEAGQQDAYFDNILVE